MRDYAHEKTDEILENLEKRLNSHYQSVTKKANKKYAATMSSFYTEMAKKEKALENGDITQDEYDIWLKKQSNSSQTKKAINQLTDSAVKADSKAAEIINGTLAGIFLINLRWTANEVKKQNGGVKIKTELIRHDSEKEIKAYYQALKERREQRKLWEEAELNMMKDKAWNKGHFYTVVKHGVDHGYSIDKISKHLEQVFEMDKRAARRWARTTVTGVENEARLQYAIELVEKGYEVEKEWISTLDKRTRDSHRKMNYEKQNVMEDFSNNLRYPGDTFSRQPEEYINCRCHMNINILYSPEGFEELVEI